MRKFSGRLFAVLLSAAMVFGLSGTEAFAAETDAGEPAAIADAQEYNVKYAVSLWGIEQDVDESGHTLGLTFGPSTGANYINTYNAHLSEEEYNAGGICLHWMSWEEIARQSRIDPTAFEACLENGCTHSVDLTLNDTLLDTSYAGQMDDGDGAGSLYRSIAGDYRYWNSENDTNGGWPASQVRAVLNGKDELTTGYAKYALDESDCLFSCFPAELQNAVVAKAVKSDSSYKSLTEENNVTSYDRLWLFSGKEVYVDSGSNNAMIRPLEGEVYQRSELFDITTASYSGLANYYEAGSAGNWWLRTMPMNNDTQIFLVYGSGATARYGCLQTNVGLAPGFCLAGPVDKTELAALVDAVNDLNGEMYTPGSWAEFEAALDAAKGILDKEDATQTEVDDALLDLQTAIDNLAEPADKTELAEEVAAAEEEMKDKNAEDYTPASWGALEEALANAKAVLADENATQEEVDAILEELETACNSLTEAADKAELENAVSKAEDLKESDYTADSWTVLKEALAAAEAVINDPNATREEVSSVLAELETARKNLVKKDTSGSGTKVETIEKVNGTWTYTVNGKPDYTYTGFGSNSNGKWYVEKGIVTFKKNDVLKDSAGAIGTKGTWYYVVGSKVQTGYNGVANYKNANGWWYIKDGKVDFSANTVAKNNKGWWYVTGGKVNFSYTGVANYKNASGWWYIKNGQVDFSANTVAKNKNGWWYVTGGKVNFGYTGVANYKNASGWWYIKSGKVDFTFNGIASNRNGTWYIKGGKVDFSYTGTVRTGGKSYTVTKGKVS